jgi:hypothetical protein
MRPQDKPFIVVGDLALIGNKKGKVIANKPGIL